MQQLIFVGVFDKNLNTAYHHHLGHHTPALQLTTGQALSTSTAPCGYCCGCCSLSFLCLFCPWHFSPQSFFSHLLCVCPLLIMTGSGPSLSQQAQPPCPNPSQPCNLLVLWPSGSEKPFKWDSGWRAWGQMLSPGHWISLARPVFLLHSQCTGKFLGTGPTGR